MKTSQPIRYHYTHVDVFTSQPFGGNPLPVFTDARGLSADTMLAITREFRQFETIFLVPDMRKKTVKARIFDLFEELPFAGHPLLGAAAALHAASGETGHATWRFDLSGRVAPVTVERGASTFSCMLDQGPATFIGEATDRQVWATAFGLSVQDLVDGLPLSVLTTGLRYLVVPVVPGALERARVVEDLTGLLSRVSAQFAVLLDEAALEIRHWNNDGLMEDAATGSAAGVVGAYRIREGLAPMGESFVLHQGRFVGRPSELRVTVEKSGDDPGRVLVGGAVVVMGHGELEVHL